MHPDVAPLVQAGRLSEAVGNRLSQLAPGCFCSHNTWGAGKVKSWSLTRGKIIIDFERESDKEMGLQFALQKTTPLPADHLNARKIEDMDHLRSLAKKDPVALVTHTLESHDNSMLLDELDAVLCGSVIKENVYKSWWEKTKKMLRSTHLFSVPSKRTEPLILRASDLSAADILINDCIDTKSPRKKLDALQTIIKKIELFEEDITPLEPLAAHLAKVSEQSQSLRIGFVFEIIVSSLQIDHACNTKLLSHKLPDLPSLLIKEESRLCEALKGRSASTQRTIFEHFPEAFGDEWLEKLLNIFDEVDSRGVSEMAKFLENEEQLPAFHAHLKKAIAGRSLGVESLLWVCRQRKTDSRAVFDLEVGNAVLSLLDRDSLSEGPSKTTRLKTLLSHDRQLIEDLLKNARPNDALQFGRRLYSSPAFEDLDRKSLLARVIKLFPNAQELVNGHFEKKEEGLISSEESILKRRAVLNELIKVKIPENTKEIAIARSYGDLKENFEYKSAKQMQAVLLKRKSELEKELASVHPTNFSNVDTSSVSIGTVVTLLNLDTDKQASYTILGAWDSQPEKNIFSYLSEVGKGLLGAKENETRDVRDLQTEEVHPMRILSISAYQL